MGFMSIRGMSVKVVVVGVRRARWLRRIVRRVRGLRFLVVTRVCPLRVAHLANSPTSQPTTAPPATSAARAACQHPETVPPAPPATSSTL